MAWSLIYPVDGASGYWVGPAFIVGLEVHSTLEPGCSLRTAGVTLQSMGRALPLLAFVSFSGLLLRWKGTSGLLKAKHKISIYLFER